MNISLIAAIGKNRELGFGNKLPWHLPDDLKRFKEITRGHTVIMGRKTFESIGKPLPNRRNIVITRDKNYLCNGVDVAHTLEEAITMSRLNLDIEEVFVIGGGEIFNLVLPYAHKMYLTHVETEVPSDAFFPEFDLNEWKISNEEFRTKDEKHLYNFTFKVYEKIS